MNAYLLTSAAFIILGGGAADKFGPRLLRRRYRLFALAAMISRCRPRRRVVATARCRVGAAFAVAGTLAALTERPEGKRPGAIGAWTGFLMLGFSIGPLIGGAVTHYAGWRTISG